MTPQMRISLLFTEFFFVLIPMTSLAEICPTPTDSDAHHLLLVRIETANIEPKVLAEPKTIGGYRFTPLVPRIAYTKTDERKTVWLVATPTSSNLQQVNGSWDEAHEFVRKNKEMLVTAFKAEGEVYAEPNQLNCPDHQLETGTQPNPHWPDGPDFAWHLGPKFTQLQLARKNAQSLGCKPRITILDTGITEQQVTKPRHILDKLQYNFLDKNTNVSDPGTSGTLKNPGHGTGTIAILAGNYVSVKGFSGDLGGAPDADIVPVRIADSVVHFWSKEMAEGIEYAAHLEDNSGIEYCDVISISMGGLASRAWGDAVNDAYERGVVIVAAAGNNFSNLPTHYTVYPSRFNRVVTVTGATEEYLPYIATKGHAKDMQGNYGPPSVMLKAIAAYTPNIPWARWNTSNVIDLDGGGTSAATPQVAAAAALWLQKNSKGLSGWQRVEATKAALFSAADTTKKDSTIYFGNGLLRAADALKKKPVIKDLHKESPDDVIFPFWRILLGLDEHKPPHEGEERMYEVEALNIATRSKLLSPYTGDHVEADVTKEQRANFAKSIIQDPNISTKLREYIKGKRLVESQ